MKKHHHTTSQHVLKGAFRVNQAPLPWKRAVSSGIASGVPVFIGALFGHLDYGLTASIGGFVYLYTGGESYRKRAITLFLVAVGLSVSFALGGLLSGSLWGTAVMLGLIGAIAVFLFGAFGIAGPAPLFFVLAFLVSSSVPGEPKDVLVRSGLTFLGGLFAWGIAMAGWLRDRHGPETDMLQKTYLQLAAYLSAAGTPGFHAEQHRTVLMLKSAGQTVTGRGEERFSLLLQKADDLFLAIHHFAAEEPNAETENISAAVRNVAALIRNPQAAVTIEPSGSETKAQKKLYAQLQEVLRAASGEQGEKTERSRLQSPFLFLQNAFSWDSPVFIRALKYGIVLMAASLFAGGLGFHRSYWIPLSAAAVMLGTTVLFTLHRAIQRSAGTIIGVIIAAAILNGRPEGVYIALCVAVLQCLLELFIVRNYVFAVPFLTANALLIAESLHTNESVGYFMTARLTDVIIGSLIGLAGTMLLWRRFSSKRLPELLSVVIRREGEILENLLTPDTRKEQFDVHHLRVSLIQLRDEYDKALGEYPKSHSDVLWPAIAGAEHLGYYLLSAYKYNRRAAIDQKEVRRAASLFDNMADAALTQTQPSDTEVPALQAYPRISEELSVLYNGLRTAYER